MASLFIADSRRRMVAILLWPLAFIVMLGLSAWIGHREMVRFVDGEVHEEFVAFTELKRNVISTFAFMREHITAEPCSPEFQEQLRVVAYLPDGLNEFLYAPGGVAKCSVTLFAIVPPVDFGTADVPAEANSGRALWLDRELAFLGMPGMTGMIVTSEPYATIVPPQSMEPSVPGWLRVEMGLSTGGRWLHRNGEAGVHQRHAAARQEGGIQNLFRSLLYRQQCEENGVHCVVAEIALADAARTMIVPLLVILFGSIAVASWLSHEALRCMRRYWSFESRFLRNFGPDSVICTYQPVLQVSDGSICGCEVLVRWRDLDGSVVSPNRFLPILDQRKLTFRLTQIVVAKAFGEIGSLARPDRPLQVSFNVFPRDLDHRKLIPLFSDFLADRQSFSVVVEVIESEAMPLDQAQAEIEALLEAGIFTHIDDFGVGYSNIHNLAALSVHAVKVDRAFAMAPEGAMLDRMLLPAIAMIRTCGHLVCVEGVESAERLRLLSSGEIGADYVQGYHVSRPLPVEEFRQFLEDTEGLPDRLKVAA